MKHLTAAWQKVALDLTNTIYVAEGLMAEHGMSGKTIHMAKANGFDDPTYEERNRPVQEWCWKVSKGQGGPDGFRVYASDYTLDEAGPRVVAMVTGMGSIVTRPVTTELTLLHEIAHVITRTREGQGHDVAYTRLCRDLYTEHISQDAGDYFWGMVEHKVDP